MKKNLLFKNLKTLCLVFLYFVLGASKLLAQDVLFTTVNPITDEFIISNTTGATIDLNDYWFCAGAGTYVRLGTLTPISGNIMLGGGQEVVLTYDVDENSGGVGLYTTNSGGFSNQTDPAVFKSFVQWERQDRGDLFKLKLQDVGLMKMNL